MLNRSSPDNFNHPILPTTELDLQGKVLMIEDEGSDGSEFFFPLLPLGQHLKFGLLLVSSSVAVVVSGLWVSDGGEGEKLLQSMTRSAAFPP